MGIVSLNRLPFSCLDVSDDLRIILSKRHIRTPLPSSPIVPTKITLLRFKILFSRPRFYSGRTKASEVFTYSKEVGAKCLFGLQYIAAGAETL